MRVSQFLFSLLIAGIACAAGGSLLADDEPRERGRGEGPPRGERREDDRRDGDRRTEERGHDERRDSDRGRPGGPPPRRDGQRGPGGPGFRGGPPGGIEARLNHLEHKLDEVLREIRSLKNDRHGLRPPMGPPPPRGDRGPDRGPPRDGDRGPERGPPRDGHRGEFRRPPEGPRGERRPEGPPPERRRKEREDRDR